MIVARLKSRKFRDSVSCWLGPDAASLYYECSWAASVSWKRRIPEDGEFHGKLTMPFPETCFASLPFPHRIMLPRILRRYVPLINEWRALVHDLWTCLRYLIQRFKKSCLSFHLPALQMRWSRLPTEWILRRRWQCILRTWPSFLLPLALRPPDKWLWYGQWGEEGPSSS